MPENENKPATHDASASLPEMESPNKFTEFVDFIDRGTKSLEAMMDEIMADAGPALKEGEQNMNRMREHVGRLKSGIQKVKDFNNKMGNR